MQGRTGARTSTPNGGKLHRKVLTIITATFFSSTLVALAGGSAPTSSGATTPAGQGALKLTTTLAGKTALPTRVHWVARIDMPSADVPQFPANLVDHVDFKIDGVTRWVSKAFPYTYAGWGNYLVTTFLTPGKHTFTTEVTSTDGRKASETVVASVSKPSAPPAALAGRWMIQRKGFPVDAAGNSLDGRWDLVFDEIGAWVLDPTGSGAVDGVRIEGDTVILYGGITMGPRELGVSAYGHKDIVGGLCGNGGETVLRVFDATFKWSVQGDKLTLRAINPACMGEEVNLWTGTWTRTSGGAPRGPLLLGK
ncbi:hypothetical protein [Deinococcus yavapaiensis]|uniref:Uncharacterized protein n=1 Tax=Deinococcus yavapaiensis KR-236 TaxID=694435 RepID=A0A318S2S1_9DEIO|nr:hypothetical protein [Deinococcus yavapaiensis]PYE52831.1 hypothetical protein DES52_1111 [Deinococcus yavapaiensis KR-236]